MESGLRRIRERHQEEQKARTRQVGISMLSPVLEALNDQPGQVVTTESEAAQIVDWIGNNFPFPGPGSTCEWARVPGAKTISVPQYEPMALYSAFDDLIEHVGATDNDKIFILGHSDLLPTLSMSLRACRTVFELLADVHGQEMHIVSPYGGWYMEFDPFFKDRHGGKVVTTQEDVKRVHDEYRAWANKS